MRKILIADRSEDLCAVLTRTFRRDFQVFSCCDGIRTVELAREIRPDVLLLDLSLPQLDGLTVLRELSGALPPAVLAFSDLPSGYVYQTATDLGSSLILLRPFRAQAVYGHVIRILEYLEKDRPLLPDPQSVAAAHLQVLQLEEGRAGFQQLRVAIPLYAQDPAIGLTKELYPEVARLCATSGDKSVEHAIRTLIKDTWKRRNKAVWEHYFPGRTKCPTNKQFIACLSKFQNMPNWQDV